MFRDAQFWVWQYSLDCYQKTRSLVRYILESASVWIQQTVSEKLFKCWWCLQVVLQSKKTRFHWQNRPVLPACKSLVPLSFCYTHLQHSNPGWMHSFSSLKPAHALLDSVGAKHMAMHINVPTKLEFCHWYLAIILCVPG